ncbi:hypothetical protein KPATCC21470_2589 [Kitasatospora purpeofusca]
MGQRVDGSAGRVGRAHRPVSGPLPRYPRRNPRGSREPPPAAPQRYARRK